MDSLSTSEHSHVFWEEALWLSALLLGLRHWLGFSHEEEKSRINTFVHTRDVIRGFIQIHCPWFEWRYVAWWLICFGDLVKGIGSLSLWFSPFHHFAILFLEVKPVFLPLERPAAHDWMPDICHFFLCGRWNHPMERLPCCWHYLGLIGFFCKTGNEEPVLSCPAPDNVMTTLNTLMYLWCIYAAYSCCQKTLKTKACSGMRFLCFFSCCWTLFCSCYCCSKAK